MAPHSSTLAWKIPWTEEPGGLQSVGLLGVGHDWAPSLSLFTFMHWRRKWQPTPVFLLENPRDGGAWRAAVYGVAPSRTRLKRLSSSSSSRVITEDPLLWGSLCFQLHWCSPSFYVAIVSASFSCSLAEEMETTTWNSISVITSILFLLFELSINPLYTQLTILILTTRMVSISWLDPDG